MVTGRCAHHPLTHKLTAVPQSLCNCIPAKTPQKQPVIRRGASGAPLYAGPSIPAQLPSTPAQRPSAPAHPSTAHHAGPGPVLPHGSPTRTRSTTGAGRQAGRKATAVSLAPQGAHTPPGPTGQPGFLTVPCCGCGGFPEDPCCAIVIQSSGQIRLTCKPQASKPVSEFHHSWWALWIDAQNCPKLPELPQTARCVDRSLLVTAPSHHRVARYHVA